MASFEEAVKLTVDMIVEGKLFSFNSLSELTQWRLLNAYGKEFENAVNNSLPAVA